MPNTTNFNFPTPADTDLVKDGASAIRSLGNSIDTAFVDLKGGTTGQILSKASNTDLDYTWITNDVGDITAVTAGTGISGGGTSGAVTITNSMATEITAAGDIIVGTGSATFDNLPIGTTGQILTADTTVSPYKVKWAAPSAAAFVGAAIYDTNNTQAIGNNADVMITFNSEYFDTDGFHSTVTNTSRMTIPSGKGGKYLVIGATCFVANATGDRLLGIYKNGTRIFLNQAKNTGQQQPFVINQIMDLAATDYIELGCVQDSGGNLDIQKTRLGGVGNATWFSIQYLGA